MLSWKKYLIVFVAAATIAAVFLFGDLFIYKASLKSNYAKEALASIFFPGDLTVEDLRENFLSAQEGEDKVKILIVPGHDPDSGGAEFRNLKERHMNVFLAEELELLFANDDIFEVIVTRDQQEYDPIFAEYFDIERESIKKFINKHEKKMRDLIRRGRIENVVGVPHNNAGSEVAIKLYGINKWANENDIDLVVHIHFNDHGGRKRDVTGKYSGFAIYVPEKQYSNGEVSLSLARSIFSQIYNYYPKSNLPGENRGIVPDQKLIAIGANKTLDPAVALIEYGYVYELQFRYKSIRELVLRELAFRTHKGIMDFFEDLDTSDNPETRFLSFGISKNITKKGDKSIKVLYLQTALSFEEVYPPRGFSRNECSLDGIFGNCTVLAMKAFQRKYDLGVDGVAGSATISKINELYNN